MKTLKQAIVGIMTAVLLLALIIVNVQVGLNDGTNSEISLLGAEISFVETAFAQDTPPGEEEGDLRCNDIFLCTTNRGCGTSGTPVGCDLHCNDEGEDPLKCPEDGDPG